MYNYREALLSGEKKIGVWGVGHIGYSTVSHFGAKGVRCIGVDVDEEKIARISRGESPIFAMDFWLGFNPGYLYRNGIVELTTDWRELISDEILAHLICIPTERDGKPYWTILEDVCSNLTHLKDVQTPYPPLVIIESTLTPNTTDDVVIPILEEAGLKVGDDILVGCAPRRDWFATPDKSLPTLPRAFGGSTPETTEAMEQVLGIVCQNLVPAPDHLHAEIVKSVENAYRHMEIALANELSLAYPHLNMRKVLELVGTKWNVGTFFPSVGVGGYCIPLASHYVLEGAKKPEHLTLLQDTIETSEAQPQRVAEYLLDRNDVENVGIMGLAYTKNMRVHAQSPTTKIAPMLARNGVQVKINDPHYSSEEIQEIVGVEKFDFPEGLKEFDTILVVASHREYRSYTRSDVLRHVVNCRLVIDNAELWRDLDLNEHGIEYYLPGNRNWLGMLDGTESGSPG
jgi:nucleotide sugar dehydrogenase